MLIVVRGFPDSSKKATAMDFESAGCHWVEADHYFYGKEYQYYNEDGTHKYDKSKLKDAHAWCQNQVRQALAAGKDVVVSNTAIRRWEVAVYLKIAREFGVRFEVIECTNDGYDDYPPSCTAQWISDARQRWEPWIRR